MDPIGGKRKFKENAFTAKAESGTLKVKILRKDLQAASGGLGTAQQAAGAGTSLGSFLSATRAKLGQQPPEPPRSPPKPRPNRKHVPIFYQTHHTHSSSSSDGSVAASASSDGAGDASTSSATYGGRFSSLLSGLQLNDASGNNSSSSNSNAGAHSLLRPPAINPLFARNDSDGAFGDLLRHAFPSAQGSAQPLSFASSAAASLASLSAAARDLSPGESAPPSTIGYRFNPFTALQSAIDVHQATLSASASAHAPYQLPHERRFLHQQSEQDEHVLAGQDSSMDSEDADEVGALGPPPAAPPAFSIQNSLIGGGIEMQPVIANVNTYNFDWSHRGGRPRSGSLPSVLENGVASSSSSSNSATSGDGSNSNAASASNVHMWKEV